MPHLLSHTKNSFYFFFPFGNNKPELEHFEYTERVLQELSFIPKLSPTYRRRYRPPPRSDSPCPTMAAGLGSQHEAQPRTARRCPG